MQQCRFLFLYSFEHSLLGRVRMDDLLKLVMSASAKTRLCWRKDLSEFRGLSERECAGFLLVLEWCENGFGGSARPLTPAGHVPFAPVPNTYKPSVFFRLRHDLEANREAAKIFWRTEQLREDRPREQWQLDQWGDAVKGRIDD